MNLFFRGHPFKFPKPHLSLKVLPVTVLFDIRFSHSVSHSDLKNHADKEMYRKGHCKLNFKWDSAC